MPKVEIVDTHAKADDPNRVISLETVDAKEYLAIPGGRYEPASVNAARALAARKQEGPSKSGSTAKAELKSGDIGGAASSDPDAGSDDRSTKGKVKG